jgi:ABC-type branched-subunit amino acid transport system substrate-binding protein/TolA-binding protein
MEFDYPRKRMVWEKVNHSTLVNREQIVVTQNERTMMKLSYKVLIILAMFLVLACGTQPIGPKTPQNKMAADKLYSAAEELLQAKSYRDALNTFDQYINTYPNGPMAAAALMQTGDIYNLLEDYAKARDRYKRVLAEYPDSHLVPDAGVAILSTLYNEAKYEDVIAEAEKILSGPVSETHLLHIYTLLGDTYSAVGLKTDAVYFYALAIKRAGESEKANLTMKFRDVIMQLSSEDIAALTEQLDQNQTLQGYLMYQLGLKHIAVEEYDEALKVLTEFVERFPDHEHAIEARDQMAALKERSGYNRDTLGCLLPLSGRYSYYGNRALRGIELALVDFSSRGSNPEIKMIVKDTESDPEKAVQAVRELAEEKVAAIIGPIITAEHAATEAQDQGVPIITLTQKEHITDIGDYVFRNFLTPQTQVETLIHYAVDVLGLTSFAILYPDETYGEKFMNLFWDEVIKSGGAAVAVESYDSSQTDFADSIKKMVGLYYDVPEHLKMTLLTSEDTTPEQGSTAETEDNEDDEPQPIVDFDAIFIPDAPNKVGLIVPQLAFHDVEDVYLLGTNLWYSEKLIEMAKQYVQGAIMTAGFFPQSGSPAVQDFVRLFEDTFGEQPGFIEAITYDTAMMLFKTLGQSDSQYRSAIKDALLRLFNYPGVTGVTSFESDGEVRKNPFLLQINGDQFVALPYH